MKVARAPALVELQVTADSRFMPFCIMQERYMWMPQRETARLFGETGKVDGFKQGAGA